MAPGIEVAVQRQTAALRELSRRAFPEPPAPDGPPAPTGQARAERRRQANVSMPLRCAGPVQSARQGRPGRWRR
ncbi:hypothetical protein GCM10010327_69170 [Streptomyces nitrosporeus]|nr:hypothetical protein GCM10010327_69170 [Streptomyces nitrosporeus]